MHIENRIRMNCLNAEIFIYHLKSKYIIIGYHKIRQNSD